MGGMSNMESAVVRLFDSLVRAGTDHVDITMTDILFLDVVNGLSPYILFLVSLLVISLAIAGGSAMVVLVRYRKAGPPVDGNDRMERRRDVLRYAAITGGAGFLGAIQGAAALLNMQGELVDLRIWPGERNGASVPQTEGATGLLLTWQRDPTTTMTVDWHSKPEHDSGPVLRVRSSGANEWDEVDGRSHPFPGTDRTIHRVELTDLDPGTEYQFELSGDDRRYTFRTMPAELPPDDAVVFASGGDTLTDQRYFERMNEAVMQYDLDFVQWGGDLAYAEGDPEQVSNWFAWFATIKNTLITDEGRVVPIIATIGNHEIMGKYHYYYQFPEYNQTDETRDFLAPYFHELLAFPGQPGYNVLDFGDYLSLVLLDSDHATPVEGQQTEWLEEQLAARTDRPYVIPSYHVAAFPSEKEFDARTPRSIREHWLPLFEEYGVDVALEHHNHTYKRTKPISNGEVSEDGVTYLGDGAWGVGAHSGDNRDEWYIETFESVQHGIIGRLTRTEMEFEILSKNGDRIDHFSVTGDGG